MYTVESAYYLQDMAGETLCPACRVDLREQYKNPYFVRLSGIEREVRVLTPSLVSPILIPEILLAAQSYAVKSYLDEITRRAFSDFSHELELALKDLLPPFERHQHACSHFVIPGCQEKYSLRLRRPNPEMEGTIGSNRLILAVWGNYMNDDDIGPKDCGGWISNELATIAHLTFHGNPNPELPSHF